MSILKLLHIVKHSPKSLCCDCSRYLRALRSWRHWYTVPFWHWHFLQTHDYSGRASTMALIIRWDIVCGKRTNVLPLLLGILPFATGSQCPFTVGMNHGAGSSCTLLRYYFGCKEAFFWLIFFCFSIVHLKIVEKNTQASDNWQHATHCTCIIIHSYFSLKLPCKARHSFP